MSDGPFPQPVNDFNDYIDTVTPYINANAASLSVSGANLDALNQLVDKPGVSQSNLGWRQLWLLYTSPDTVTKSIRDIVKQRRAQLEAQLRIIYGDIPQSFLTPNSRNVLNLPQRDFNPTPIQAVNFAPVISFDKISNGIQVLRFQNPQTPDSNAMPDNQKVEIQNFIGAANLPENSIQFQPLMDSGKHLLKITQQPQQKGLTAYYRARYKTNSGKTGPWSDVASEIIL
jgi:hypothetical protein